MLYRALDLAVDGYLDVVEAIGIDIDEIEEQVFGDAGGEHSERILGEPGDAERRDVAVDPGPVMVGVVAQVIGVRSVGHQEPFGV